MNTTFEEAVSAKYIKLNSKTSLDIKRAYFRISRETSTINREADKDDLYATLFEAIQNLVNETDDAASIDAATGSEATRFLALLRSYEVPPPKIFSHGGDAVVFVWKGPYVERYVTPSGPNVGFYDIDLRSQKGARVIIKLKNAASITSVMRILGGKA